MLFRSILGSTEKGGTASAEHLFRTESIQNGNRLVKWNCWLVAGCTVHYAGEAGLSLLMCYPTDPDDLPPLKWSSLKYGFDQGGQDDGKEEAHSRRDCSEASTGRCADGTGQAGQPPAPEAIVWPGTKPMAQLRSLN